MAKAEARKCRKLFYKKKKKLPVWKFALVQFEIATLWTSIVLSLHTHRVARPVNIPNAFAEVTFAFLSFNLVDQEWECKQHATWIDKQPHSWIIPTPCWLRTTTDSPRYFLLPLPTLSRSYSFRPGWRFWWKTLSAEHTFGLDCSQSEGSLSSCWIIVASQSWLREEATSFKPLVSGEGTGVWGKWSKWRQGTGCSGVHQKFCTARSSA